MTKKEIVKAVASEVDMSIKEVAQVIDTFIEYSELALQNGDCVDLTKFGKLVVVDRSERTAHNPRTGENITVPAKKAIRFKASKTLKDAINGAN
nr:MAG TPA: DNA binding protein [Caudoviricetes sp.]